MKNNTIFVVHDNLREYMGVYSSMRLAKAAIKREAMQVGTEADEYEIVKDELDPTWRKS